MVRALGFVCLFGASTDDGRSVVVNILVVRPDSCRLEERLSVASKVCGLRTNKAYQIVDRSRFVVRDLEEERSYGLSKSCEVGIGRLSVNRIKVFEGVGEFCHNLLRSHAAPAKMARPLS